MKNYTFHFHLFLFSFCCFVFFGFFSISVASAGTYQKIAPGDTVTLGEFVFDDNFIATTTPCTIGITDPLNVVKVVSTTPMTANNDGWHYYSYNTASSAPSGVWPSVMQCGSVAAGDLVKVDKSFEVVGASWTVTLSDFGGTTVNTAYKAKLQVLNSATVPTDADSLPAVVITDPAGTVQVPAGVMTKDSNGTYSYSYSISSSTVGGVWETVVSVVINGKTVRVNDYWSLSSSPADVSIIEITDKVIPTITASVRIDNKGTSNSDFYYVYCIVSSENNLCGGNDDIDSASGTAFINAGSFINLSLTLDEVPTAGTYWFKVKARALAETNWAASTEQFIAESGVTPPVSPPSGGGGGGYYYLPPITTTVIFTGRAYPKSEVTLLKDAQIVTSTQAGADAGFQITLSGLSSGNYIFAIYGEDKDGRRSSLLAFPISVTYGIITNVYGIFIPPTIMIDKKEVKKGDNITIFGQTAPNAAVTIAVNSDKQLFFKTPANKDGFYAYAVDTSDLYLGSHTAKSKAAVIVSSTNATAISSFGSVVSFKVGGKNVIAPIKRNVPKEIDANGDARINIVDFSIMAYWFKRPLAVSKTAAVSTPSIVSQTATASPALISPPPNVDLNKDGKIDLKDFSILAYYWTG